MPSRAQDQERDANPRRLPLVFCRFKLSFDAAATTVAEKERAELRDAELRGGVKNDLPPLLFDCNAGVSAPKSRFRFESKV